MPSPEIDLLLALIDQAYDAPAWHGPNLKASIRRVDAGTAAWRPGPGRRSIAEIVAHAAYWKYAVRRLLNDDPRGSFPMKGTNWFALPDPLPESEWRGLVALLESEHRGLRAAVAAFPPSRLNDPSPKKKYRCSAIIQGAASHDLYHAGQIQLLKRLQSEE